MRQQPELNFSSYTRSVIKSISLQDCRLHLRKNQAPHLGNHAFNFQIDVINPFSATLGLCSPDSHIKEHQTSTSVSRLRKGSAPIIILKASQSSIREMAQIIDCFLTKNLVANKTPNRVRRANTILRRDTGYASLKDLFRLHSKNGLNIQSDLSEINDASSDYQFNDLNNSHSIIEFGPKCPIENLIFPESINYTFQNYSGNSEQQNTSLIINSE